MSVEEVARILDAEVHTKRADTARMVSSGCASDLMSDVPYGLLISGGLDS